MRDGKLLAESAPTSLIQSYHMNVSELVCIFLTLLVAVRAYVYVRVL